MARSCIREFLATRKIGVAMAAMVVWSACSPGDSNLTTAPASHVGPPLGASNSAPIPGQYIVVLNNDVPDVGVVARALADKHAGRLLYVYRFALKGFALRVPDAAADLLRREPTVAYVEQDQEDHLANTQPNTTWGLERISQRSSLPSGSNPNNYTYTYTYFADGTGVTVYIIDSGIAISDADFGGRASVGYDALGGNGIDCFGHGTHVAGTVGGATWGVAKNARLVAVRVADCNGGSITDAGVIAAVDWVTGNRVLPAVANMSLEGPRTAAKNQAVENSINSGYVTYVAAAGNDMSDACTLSPQSAPDAIVVGATDISDHFASFSNFGTCVTINAPGVAVTSDWLNGGTRVEDGTSMSSPHVAGTAALYLSVNAAASPAQVKGTLTANATTGSIIGLPGNTPNLVDYSAFIVSGPPTSASAGGGVDTALTCGPFGFGGTTTCGTILGITASGSATIVVWYDNPNGQPGCESSIGSHCTRTLILAGATASGGVDTTLTCGPYGFGGTKVCGGIVAVSASGSNAVSVRYMPPTGAPRCATMVGTYCTRTLTLSGTTASAGVDTAQTCGPYGFGGTKVCGSIVAVSASGSNVVSVRYRPPTGAPRCAVIVGSYCTGYLRMP